VASVNDNDFYPICFLADVFNCLTCGWFEWDTASGRCRNHGTAPCKLHPKKAEAEPPKRTIYQ
jgi:hypothetical protein